MQQQQLTVAQLVAQLQALPQHLPVIAFSHKQAQELELYNAELYTYDEEAVLLNFDV
jgi:hypothetical protein